jgi:hypothetical protein
MPVPAKVLHALALVGKIETVYGTAIALTPATDGLQMQFSQDDVAAVFNLEYMGDGNLGPSISSLGQIARVSPQGLFASGSVPTLLRLPAAAYSASVQPNLQRLLQIAGFDSTGTYGVGTEKYVYAPTAVGTAFSSMTLNAYERGEMIAITGALANMKIDGKDGKPPLFTFDVKGIGGLPTDQSPLIPSTLVYPNSAKAPLLNQAVTLVFGSFTTNAVLKSWSFDLGRKYDSARTNLTGANICAGYVPSMRNPVFKLELEATALVGSPFHTTAGFDPYNLRDAATALGTVSVKLGSVQYNRITLAMNQAQVTNAVRKGEGPTATVELEVTAYNSTPVANDDITITCD